MWFAVFILFGLLAILLMKSWMFLYLFFGLLAGISAGAEQIKSDKIRIMLTIFFLLCAFATMLWNGIN